jgi:hypothetical protein
VLVEGVVSVGAGGEGGVGPVEGVFDEVGGEAVSFDVAGGDNEVVVGLDGKVFEAILIERSVSDGVVEDAGAHGVGVGEPAEQAAAGDDPFVALVAAVVIAVEVQRAVL